MTIVFWVDFASLVSDLITSYEEKASSPGMFDYRWLDGKYTEYISLNCLQRNRNEDELTHQRLLHRREASWGLSAVEYLQTLDGALHH